MGWLHTRVSPLVPLGLGRGESVNENFSPRVGDTLRSQTPSITVVTSQTPPGGAPTVRHAVTGPTRTHPSAKVVGVVVEHKD